MPTVDTPPGSARTVAGRVAAALVVGGIVVQVGLPWVERQVTHRPDVDAFHADLVQALGDRSSVSDPRAPDRDVAWVRDDAVSAVRAGEAACSWLAASEPSVPWRGTGEAAVRSHLREYLDDVDFVPVDRLSAAGREGLVLSAWENLCWWDRQDEVVDPPPVAD